MSADSPTGHEHSGPGYASPEVAREQPPEKFVYVASLYEGTGIDKPDFIAVGLGLVFAAVGLSVMVGEGRKALA